METYTYKLVEDEHGNIQCGDKLYRFEETIEEEKKIPEKINMFSSMSIFDKKNIEEYLRTLFSQQKEQVSKLNEILDYLDYLKSKGEQV